jgi:hypothetical protein
MDIDLKLLRQRCERKLLTLELPVPFNARRLCDRLAQDRGRPIVLKPFSGGEGPFGLWVAGPSIDAIFFERDTSPLHQEHIILHEACHIICDHYPASVSAAAFSQLLFPDLHPEMVRRLLQRAGYSTDEEREAELLASLILRRTASVPDTDTTAPGSVKLHPLVHLEATLQDGSR